MVAGGLVGLVVYGLIIARLEDLSTLVGTVPALGAILGKWRRAGSSTS